MDIPRDPPRILCLHGYHGTAAILRRQMAGLVSALPELTELVFLDAPTLRRGDFGWWHPGFAGWESSRDAVLSHLRSEPFDGVLGFSQGAAMAGLIAAVQHAEEPSRLFDLVIMISGFTSQLPEHARLFETPIDLRSLHIIGRSDLIVSPRESAALTTRFADPVVLEHAGGHVVPSSHEIADRVARFIDSSHHAPHPAR
jgi:pimeloyl-ACP methyl ester carboxylesterase